MQLFSLTTGLAFGHETAALAELAPPSITSMQTVISIASRPVRTCSFLWLGGAQVVGICPVNGLTLQMLLRGFASFQFLFERRRRCSASQSVPLPLDAPETYPARSPAGGASMLG